jgi:hypothetical protein
MFETLINATNRNQAAWPTIHLIELAAPTTVSPPPTTEQKQYQKNNQYGFHVVPPGKR